MNTTGVILVHPSKQLLNEDISRYQFIRDQIRLRQGYIEYDWKNPGEKTARPKALYMVYFEPLDWIISASSYREEFDELLHPDDFRDAVLSPKFGETGYAYILNTRGEMIIHPKYDKFNVLLQEELPSRFAREMLSKPSGILEYEWRNPEEKENRKKIAAYDLISEYGWIVASSSYLEEIMRPVTVARLITYGSAILLFLVAIPVSFFLSGKISRPVDMMMRQLDKNAREGIHGSLPVMEDDELGRLAKEFNAYFEKIDEQNEELRTERERYRNLFEASPDSVLLLHDLTIVDCNPATYTIFHGDESSILGTTVTELSPKIQPDGVDSVARAKEIIRDTPDNHLSIFEWCYQTVTGIPFQAEVRIRSFQIGEEQFYLAFVRDITEFKKTLEALQKSEMKYRHLVENATDAIFIAREGRILFANSKATEMTGYSNEELLVADFGLLVHPADLALVSERHTRRLQGETDIPQNYTFRILTKEGKKLTVEFSTVLIEWNNRPATLNFIREITEQRKLEALFQRAQKMESIGTLAGGIAHDFNNLLMGIQGRTSLLLFSSPISPVQKGHLQAIEEYVKSASGLTRQLLGVGRGGKYDPKPTDLVALVENNSTMFSRTRKELELRFHSHRPLVVVEVDTPQIDQVLLNIFVNAWQAMPEGGELIVDIDTKILSDAYCSPHGVQAGEYAVVSITDTGIGMDQDIRDRIFDPFFTTKEKVRGIGLGLASAYGIIKNHKGFITVESKVGEGSSFFIYLPVSNKSLIREKPIESAMIQGTGTVLIVDDEEMILEVGEALLEKLGYSVLCANGGLKGVKMVEQFGSGINLIILDLVMPDLDGGKTFDRIREINSSIPIILSSGYSADGEAAKILSRGCSDFIQKPFSISELSQKIEKALKKAVG